MALQQVAAGVAVTPNDEVDDVAILMDDEDLRELASLLHSQEEQLMDVIDSLPDRNAYLEGCSDARDKVFSLLDKAKEMHSKYDPELEQAKANIAQDILRYLKYALNFSMQNIRNCSLRLRCVYKIEAFFDSLDKDLLRLDPESIVEVRCFAEEVVNYKNNMWELATKTRSASSRAFSKTFSKWLVDNKITYSDLLDKYIVELEFEGEFESLAAEKQLQVLYKIINESRRAEVSVPKGELAFGGLGVAVLVATATMMVWDIVTSEHKLEALVHNTLNAFAEIGAFSIQVALEMDLAWVAADVTGGVFIVAAIGFLVGFGAGIFLLWLGDRLAESFFGTGLKTPPDLDGLKFNHAETTPDGMEIAFDIIANRSSQ